MFWLADTAYEQYQQANHQLNGMVLLSLFVILGGILLLILMRIGKR